MAVEEVLQALGSWELRLKATTPDDVIAQLEYFGHMAVVDGPVDVAALYHRLLIAQQPAYGALLELEDVAVVSASPELFFEWDGASLVSRPMKGTVKRGRTLTEDNARPIG